MRATIEYHYGPYCGEEVVYGDVDDENEMLIACMWARLRRRGLLTLPMACQSARVVSRELEEPEDPSLYYMHWEGW